MNIEILNIASKVILFNEKLIHKSGRTTSIIVAIILDVNVIVCLVPQCTRTKMIYKLYST